MSTVNVSIPDKLKDESQLLISQGHFASFSDVVRTALRHLIMEMKHEVWVNDALEDQNNGVALLLKDKSHVKSYLENLKAESSQKK